MTPSSAARPRRSSFVADIDREITALEQDKAKYDAWSRDDAAVIDAINDQIEDLRRTRRAHFRTGGTR